VNFFKKNFKIFLKTFSRIFQEYSRNISQKVVTKVVKRRQMWLMLSRLHSVKAEQKLKTISQHICKLGKQINIEIF
jgi:hypothetical protein